MNEDIKPKTVPIMSLIATGIAVATAVWAGTTFLQTRADKSQVEKIVNDSFSLRLDVETMKGDLKSLNIRAERMEKGVDSLNTKMDRRERRER